MHYWMPKKKKWIILEYNLIIFSILSLSENYYNIKTQVLLIYIYIYIYIYNINSWVISSKKNYNQ